MQQLLEQRAEEHRRALYEQSDSYESTVATLERELDTRDGEVEAAGEDRRAAEREAAMAVAAHDALAAEAAALAARVTDLEEQLAAARQGAGFTPS